ncbi:polysaccharide pyruvyl transferase family protein [Rathayibacter sp. SD072]|uniref:polysaccharide pyruvyl transferase family protein n=1 Tax=Rathayibacter sp. SD072 TaxID=2781731 RepID=UPI001A957ABE|nr:polysaccharide pyruvyl transferase family protein [Rathayibacter sp. SD072]MBO0982882.1 polysaccharide pyruvyl transferase family protein [Rathayibacter sp. SD072]
MKVAIIHAYSTTNSGDGLLVEEARALVLSAVPGAIITLVALDPESFDANRYEQVIHPLAGGTRSIGSLETLRRGGTALLTGRRSPDYARVIEEADLVVGVGGGYLRTKGPVEVIKMMCTNFVQMPRRRDRAAFVYLPQSIGPLNLGTRRLIAARLKRAVGVFARDDRSVQQLSGLTNVHRAPDMALLGLPDELDLSTTVAAGAAGPVGIVARALSSSRSRLRSYEARINELASEPNTELLAQATARGNNDPEFYERLGYRGPFRLLRDAVSSSAARRPSVVVSVRLHGSIQTIRSGVPSIHLSYERKGWGAYGDLGIDRYVHNAFDFDPSLVRDQIIELSEDPADYWRRVGNAVEPLAEQRRNLSAVLTRAVDRVDSRS